MSTEKHSTERLDADIQQSKADILRFLQQTAKASDAPAPDADIKDTDTPEITFSDDLEDSFSEKPAEPEEIEIPELDAELPTEPTAKQDLERELKEKDREIRQLNGVLDSLEEQLTVKKDQIKKLASSLRNHEQNFRIAVEAEIKQLKQEYENQKQEYQSRLESEQAASEKKRQDEMPAFAGRIAELEEANEQSAREKLSLSEDLAESRNAAAALENQLTQTQRQLDAVRAEKDKLQDRVDELDGVLANQQTQLNAASTQNNDLQNRIEELNKASFDQQAELEKARQQLNAIQIENQTAASSLEACKNDIQSLRDQLEQEKQKTEQARREFDSHIAELESLNGRLRHDNSTLSSDLSASRNAAAAIENTIWQTQHQLETEKEEKHALKSRIEELSELSVHHKAELEKAQQTLEAMRNDKRSSENLTSAFEHDIQSLQTQLDQQKRAAEQTCQQLRLRIAELDDQLTERDQQTLGKIKEMEHLIAEQKLLLDKTEQQRRELENQLAAVQAENDRFAAAESGSHTLHERLDKAEQQLEMVNHKLERLKGDHQLVGEENNQLHHILHLRDQELDKAITENTSLKQEIAELKASQSPAAEQSIPAQEPISESPISAATEETIDIEPSESETGIPDFNLAEQIMAEQRRATGAQRQSPAGRSGASRQDAAARVVEQFVGTPAKIESPNPPLFESPASQPTSATPSPTASEELFAEIVRQDILQFLEQKRKSFQQPRWAWTKIN